MVGKIKISETDIQRSIMDFLHARGIFCWRNNSTGIYDPVRKIYRKNTGKYSINGVSDILGILPGGKFLAIEVKSASGKLSDDQKFFINQIKLKGGVAFTARSIEDVIVNLGLWGL
jgi:hypothetical protein